MGNEFDVDIIAALSNKNTSELKRVLTELQSTGILQEVSSRNTYVVAHALMRDVVYNNIPLDTRKLLHKKTADYLHEKYKAQLEEHTNELAYHYSNSSDGEKALHYLIRAGDEAKESYLLDEADRYYREAISCFTNNRDLFNDSYLLFIELHYKIGITNQILGKLNEALTVLIEGIKVSQDHQIYELLPKIYHQVARVFSIKGDYDKAFHYIGEAIKISSRTGNPYDMLEFLREEANLYTSINNTTKAQEVLEKGLSESRKLEDEQLVSKYLNNLGILFIDKDYKKALRYFKESFSLRKEMKDKLALSVVLSNIAAVFYKIKKLDNAIKYTKRALHISTEIEDKLGICLNLNNLGEMYLAHDELHRAFSYFRDGLRHSREISWKEGIVADRIHISLIYVLKNQNIPLAKDLLDRALRGAKELQNPELVAKCYLVQSKLLALENKPEESQLTFKNAQQVIKQNDLAKVLQDFERKVA
jgi:tetratricopeptide (TPR) repeat protein